MIKLDNFISETSPINIGVPQGSPVSPVLACLYTAEPLQKLINNPIVTTSNLPVGPRPYVDNMGFLTISDSIQDNLDTLEMSLSRSFYMTFAQLFFFYLLSSTLHTLVDLISHLILSLSCDLILSYPSLHNCSLMFPIFHFTNAGLFYDLFHDKERGIYSYEGG